jgi:3-hydroxymyristoyl/3-hydroxydecanoyl-(acyl carrier protein) dehydratase
MKYIVKNQILFLLVKKIIKIEQESTFGIMFLKNVVLHENIVKNHFVRILLTRDCT